MKPKRIVVMGSMPIAGVVWQHTVAIDFNAQRSTPNTQRSIQTVWLWTLDVELLKRSTSPLRIWRSAFSIQRSAFAISLLPSAIERWTLSVGRWALSFFDLLKRSNPPVPIWRSAFAIPLVPSAIGRWTLDVERWALLLP